MKKNINIKNPLSKKTKKKLLKEKEEEEKRKAGIVEIIRRDRLERDEDIKIQIEHNNKNNLGGKIPKVEDGVIVWVDPTPIKIPKSPITNTATLRTISDLSPDHHHHHHSLAHMPDSDDEDEDMLEKLPRVPKMFWNDHIFLRLLAKHGEDITKKIMLTVGFSELELEEILFKGKEHLKRHNKHNKKEGKEKDSKRDGRRLGNADVEKNPPSIPSPPENHNLPTPTLTVNNDSPTTIIKIRLIDGTTKEITVNHDHTVSDIIEHIRRISGVSEFKLVNTSTFPKKALTELNLTVKEANLLNTNLIQTR